jgi:hypothetical protein
MFYINAMLGRSSSFMQQRRGSLLPEKLPAKTAESQLTMTVKRLYSYIVERRIGNWCTSRNFLP